MTEQERNSVEYHIEYNEPTITQSEFNTILSGFIKYLRSSYTNMYDAYVKPSYAKVQSFDHIRGQMYINGGKDLRICSTSFSFYTCGYRLETEEGNTFVYHTPYNNICKSFAVIFCCSAWLFCKIRCRSQGLAGVSTPL